MSKRVSHSWLFNELSDNTFCPLEELCKCHSQSFSLNWKEINVTFNLSYSLIWTQIALLKTAVQISLSGQSVSSSSRPFSGIHNLSLYSHSLLAAQTVSITAMSSVVVSTRFKVSTLAELSGYNASCLSKGQVARNNVSGEEADVGELLRGCKA